MTERDRTLFALIEAEAIAGTTPARARRLRDEAAQILTGDDHD